MTTRIAAVLVLAALAAPSTAVAGPRVTITFRSGDRIRGELLDFGGVGFTIRVGNNEQRIPPGDVAVIDLTNGGVTAAEAAKIRDGRAFVVLHGGDTFYGSLYDIGGTDPLQIIFRTPYGDRTVTSSQVARIYFARWIGMPTVEASGGTTQEGSVDQGGGVVVPGNVCWTATTYTVRRGQHVAFDARGEIRLSSDPNDVAGVGGSKIGRMLSNAPLPNVLAGALIGRVGYSRPFGIGDQQQGLQMPADGVLFLGINDADCHDNAGHFRVRITPM
ncbi:MAG TPA: hypothetical protein PLN93_04305 [Vicinamibacterales bacterium]|nr:hypothetical protein [Vicinamibacterales bacterium]HOQ60798.1 hypothetical protein [Vicinamibacterales bacterium]HPK71144.1 hypothetical protein [Vicinamibacterales bacterium]